MGNKFLDSNPKKMNSDPQHCTTVASAYLWGPKTGVLAMIPVTARWRANTDSQPPADTWGVFFIRLPVICHCTGTVLYGTVKFGGTIIFMFYVILVDRYRTQCCGSESEIIRMFWLDPNPNKKFGFRYGFGFRHCCRMNIFVKNLKSNT
jgi:hypothetical protein